MAKIETLEVSVKYRVGLGDITLPKDVRDQLEKAADNGITIDLGSSNKEEYELAADWLRDHIHEKDGYQWELEIDDLTLPD